MTESTSLCKEDGLAGAASPILQIATFVVAIVAVVFPPISIWHFVKNSRKHIALARRNLFLLAFFAISGYVFIVVSVIRVFYGPEKFNCVVMILIIGLSYFVPGLVGICRLSSLYLRISYNRALIDESYHAFFEGSFSLVPGGALFVEKEATHKSCYYDEVFAKEGRQKISENKCKTFSKKIIFCLCCWKSNSNLPDSLQLRQFFASKYFINCTFLFLVLFRSLVIIWRVNDAIPFTSNCKGCLFKESLDVLPYGVHIFVISTIFCGFLLYKLRDMPDALGINEEIRYLYTFYILYFGSTHVIPASDLFIELEQDGIFHWNLVGAIFLIGCIGFSFTYQVYKVKWKSKAVSNANIGLMEILSSNEGYRAFALFSASNITLESLFFYSAVKEWKCVYEHLTEEESTIRAQAIFDKFIQSDAFLQINISNRAYNAILDAMNLGNSEDMFDLAGVEVQRLMASDVYPLFIKSQYYKAYLNGVQEV